MSSATGSAVGVPPASRLTSFIPSGIRPRKVAPIAVRIRPIPPDESTSAVSAPTPANALTHSTVPSADQRRKRPNGILAVPATIGTTEWITATNRAATSAEAPLSRRYASARFHRCVPILRPSRVSRRRVHPGR